MIKFYICMFLVGIVIQIHPSEDSAKNTNIVNVSFNFLSESVIVQKQQKILDDLHKKQKSAMLNLKNIYNISDEEFNDIEYCLGESSRNTTSLFAGPLCNYYYTNVPYDIAQIVLKVVQNFGFVPHTLEISLDNTIDAPAATESYYTDQGLLIPHIKINIEDLRDMQQRYRICSLERLLGPIIRHELGHIFFDHFNTCKILHDYFLKKNINLYQTPWYINDWTMCEEIMADCFADMISDMFAFDNLIVRLGFVAMLIKQRKPIDKIDLTLLKYHVDYCNKIYNIAATEEDRNYVFTNFPLFLKIYNIIQGSNNLIEISNVLQQNF